MEEKYSNESLSYIVEHEGLDYAVTGYVTAEKIEDPEIRALWIKARDIMYNLEKLLEEKGVIERD